MLHAYRITVAVVGLLAFTFPTSASPLALIAGAFILWALVFC